MKPKVSSSSGQGAGVRNKKVLNASSRRRQLPHMHEEDYDGSSGGGGRLLSSGFGICRLLTCSKSSVNTLACLLIVLALFFLYLAEDSIAHSNSHLDGSSHDNSHDFDGHTAVYKNIVGSIYSFSRKLTLIFLALRGRTFHAAAPSYGDDKPDIDVVAVTDKYAIVAPTDAFGVSGHPRAESAIYPISITPVESGNKNNLLKVRKTPDVLSIPATRPKKAQSKLSSQLSLKENALAKKPAPKKVEGGTTFKLVKSRNQKESDWFDDPINFNEGKYIELYPRYPGSKTGIRRDRVVNTSSISYSLYPPFRSNSAATNILGMPRSYVDTLEILKSHPLHSFNSKSLVDSIVHLYSHPRCKNIPIFISMATVGDELYWQLIENFVYSLVRFQLSQCAIVICVSDEHCMDLCARYNFPCFDYQHGISPKPSVMEQIAILKLSVVPQAMTLGVNIFMLDLDVGFLENPMIMIHAFNDSPIMDIFVQEDLIFIMNRTKAGWKKWFTEPLANIGMFLARGNNNTLQVFDISWQKYINMKDVSSKINPGKDQNHVLDAMRYGRANFGLKYAYFTNKSAVLMDKVFKFKSTVLELGGQASADFLGVNGYRTIAMHTTCYEHVTKVMGLKATNAFWHPRYFDPLTRTITKQLIYVNTKQLLDEVRSLVWLGLLTNRSVIIPNILGSDRIPNDTIESFQGQRLWPGFRVLFLKRKNGKTIIPINILEPAFYWRIARDYDIPPEPSVLMFDPNAEDMTAILEKVQQNDHIPRLVLHASKSSRIPLAKVQLGENNKRWGVDRTPPDRRGLPSGTTFMRHRLLREEYDEGYDNIMSKKSILPRMGRNLISESESSLSSLPSSLSSSSSSSSSAFATAVSTSSSSSSSSSDEVVTRVVAWAKNSVGLYSRTFLEEISDYGIIPSVKEVRDASTTSKQLTRTTIMVINEMRTCEGIFSPLKGNRTCFQICD